MYLKETAITLPVVKDWYGSPVIEPFRFILSLESKLISFGAQFPKDCLSLGKTGEFLEGLWEASVVELFIHEQKSSRYIELNLSPAGAFWIAEFSDYRKRKSELRLKPIVETKSLNGIATAVMKINTSDLMNDKFEIAQTAILKLESKTQPEKVYLARKFAWNESAIENLKCEPDFHQRKLAEVF